MLTARPLAVLCTVICAGYAVVGFWPFDFLPQNDVAWLPDGRGIAFSGHSVAYSEGPLDLGGAGEGVTVELDLRSESRHTRGITAIASLYDGELPEIVLIGTRAGDVALRVAVWTSRGERRAREVGVKAGLPPGLRRVVTVTSGAGGTAVYVDGVLARAVPDLVLRREVGRARLVLGSSPAGRHNWQGAIYGAAVFDRALGGSEVARHQELLAAGGARSLSSEPGLAALYAFDTGSGVEVRDLSPAGGKLLIPENYHLLYQPVLAPLSAGTPGTTDILVNLLGFVPFGFFFFLYLAAVFPGRTIRNAALTVLASALISTAIELVQALLPSRSSTLSDVILNTAGGALGVYGAALAASLDKLTAPLRGNHNPRV